MFKLNIHSVATLHRANIWLPSVCGDPPPHTKLTELRIGYNFVCLFMCFLIFSNFEIFFFELFSSLPVCIFHRKALSLFLIPFDLIAHLIRHSNELLFESSFVSSFEPSLLNLYHHLFHYLYLLLNHLFHHLYLRFWIICIVFRLCIIFFLELFMIELNPFKLSFDYFLLLLINV